MSNNTISNKVTNDDVGVVLHAYDSDGNVVGEAHITVGDFAKSLYLDELLGFLDVHQDGRFHAYSVFGGHNLTKHLMAVVDAHKRGKEDPYMAVLDTQVEAQAQRSSVMEAKLLETSSRDEESIFDIEGFSCTVRKLSRSDHHCTVTSPDGNLKEWVCQDVRRKAFEECVREVQEQCGGLIEMGSPDDTN